MVVGVILAAGFSSRMGRPKAQLPVDRTGRTFLAALVDTVQRGGVDDVVVVVGPSADVGAALPAAALVRVVVNPEPSAGQLSSLVAALDVVDRPGLGAILVCPVDHALVTAATVRAILESHHSSRAPIVRPVHQGRHGHPVLFDRSVIDELRRADPSVGARAVVHAHRDKCVDVTVDDEGTVSDIDTPEDFERATGLTLPPLDAE
jgi:molybdenum cofactor cytidylyltransferase